MAWRWPHRGLHQLGSCPGPAAPLGLLAQQELGLQPLLPLLLLLLLPPLLPALLPAAAGVALGGYPWQGELACHAARALPAVLQLVAGLVRAGAQHWEA